MSFLDGPTEKGRMVQALENMGLVPLQFRLDANRPDLQKLDSLLGLLATESSTFTSQIAGMATKLQGCGLNQFLKDDAKAVADIISTTTTTSSSASTNVDNIQNQLTVLDFTEEDGREAADVKNKGKQPAEKSVCNLDKLRWRK